MILCNTYKKKNININQIQDPITKSLSYLIEDQKNNLGIIIDPVEDMVDYYNEIASKHKFSLNYTLDTHVHADHISGSNKLVNLNKNCRYFMGKAGDALKITKNLILNNSLFKIGDISLKALHTPGHTIESFCFFLEPYLFTGDTLLINSTGRTDLSNGSTEMLYDSIFFTLLRLSKHSIILPGHDYQGKFSSTLEEQKNENPYLKVRDKQEFVKLKKKQKLSDPEKICISTKRNLQPIEMYKAFLQTC